MTPAPPFSPCSRPSQVKRLLDMLKLITPPPIEPISAADARIHARIEHTADDAWTKVF